VDAPSLSYARLVANVLAGAGGRLAAILIALGLATVLVATLGVAAYGTWSFFFVLIGYHAQFDFGVSVALERSVARAAAGGERGHVAPLLNAGLALTIGLSVVLQLLLFAVPATWLAGLGEPVAVRQCLLVLPLCLACSNAAAVAGAGLAGLQRTTTLMLQRTVIGGVTTLVVAGLALGGVRRLDALLLASAAGLLATAASSWRAVARATAPLPFQPWRTDRRAFREIAWLGGTLQVTTLVAQLGDQGFRLVLGSHFGSAIMGVYDLASRAAIAPRSLVAPLLVALVPFAAGRERTGDTAALSDALRRATIYAALPLLAGTIGGLAVAGPLFTVWIGGPAETVHAARRLFEIMLVSLGLQSVASPMIALARGLGRPAPEAIVTAIAQPLALVLAWQMSTPTAAVTVVAIVLIVAAAALWLWLKSLLGVAALPGPTIARLALVAAGAGAAGWATRRAAEDLSLAPIAVLLLVPAMVTVTTIALALAAGCVSAHERRTLARLAGWTGVSGSTT